MPQLYNILRLAIYFLNILWNWQRIIDVPLFRRRSGVSRYFSIGANRPPLRWSWCQDKWQILPKCTADARSSAWIRQHSDYFIFQQDGAPAHRAKETVELLKTATPVLTLFRQRACIAAGGGHFVHQLWRNIYFVNFSAWLIISFCETFVINLKISVMWL